MSAENRVKNLRWMTDPSTRGKKLEAHHWNGMKYEGGTDLFALTLVEHAYAHYLSAIRGDDPKANYWAVGMICKRMTPEDLAEFNKKIKGVK